ncbi:hypothetical protein jhhlp_003157 [Lomentospora prolificans]|uniref:6-phosphogluconate dehydrogenase NADP-binding domain-containing protein n=1 Tax=Lomentospora prolificans TaxID=41688 RepID=A0A2N3NG41_9PEZI|nr:hypothetical protein jhhlp_003157 [Lomentospora prolificans]
MPDSKPPVAFIGLGAMGFGMATQLVKQGYQVTGSDVWPPTLKRFKEAGGECASSPAEAARGKSYCVCMVATAQQTQEALLDGPDPAIPALEKGAVVLLCSTVPCGYVQDLEKQLTDRGRSDILLVDCPVSGGALRAANGTLSIMAGATDPEAITKGKDLLRAMSDPEKLYIVEGGIGAGSNMKMCHQVLASVQILAASEIMGFAAHLGLDLPSTGKALVESDGWSWMLENRLPRILHPEFQPLLSAVTIILKDTMIITSEARRYGFPTPMVSTAEQAYFVGLGRGFGADDDASLIRIYTEGRGKVGPVAGQAESDEKKLKLVTSLLKGIHLCAASECLAFAHRVGLDLDQTLELCVNAAGGSAMLGKFGPDLVNILRGNRPSVLGLVDLAQEVREAVDEAHRLKVPLFLGNQALSIMRLALQHKPKELPDMPQAMAVKVWAA